MRPSSETNPGAVLIHRIGPASPDQGTDSPPSADCCEIDEDSIPDRASGRSPFSLGETTGDTEDLNFLHGTVTFDGGTFGPGFLTDPELSNDGDPDTGANVPGGVTAGGEAYLISDLGDEYSVTGFTLRSDMSCTELHESIFDFDVSDDGVSWTDVPVTKTSDTIESTTFRITTWSIDAGADERRYWRLRHFLGSGFFCGGKVYTWGISGSSTTTTGWNVLEPLVVDDDDATSEDTDGPEHLRFDLGAEYRIIRTRIRLGTTTAGSKTLTLIAWNELDESDAVTVATIPFTATGSLTAQDVVSTFANTTAYRYWQIDGPSEIVRWFSVEFYEPTLSQSHEHDADGIAFDNTEAGLPGDPDTMQEAIDALASLIGTPTLRWEAVTNGEDVFVWEGDDLVHEWKDYA